MPKSSLVLVVDRYPIIKDFEYMIPELENFFAVRISGNNLEHL